MSSTQIFFRHPSDSSSAQDINPHHSDPFVESPSQEKQAIAASVDKLDESTYRSPSQQAAIDTLRDFEDSRILNLLSAIRLPHLSHSPYFEGLSREQFDALAHLRFCPDGLILLWLRHSRGLASSPSRKSHISGLTTPQSTVSSCSTNASRRPLRTRLRSLPASQDHLAACSDTNSHITTVPTLGRNHFPNSSPLEDFTQTARPSRVKDAHPRWCVNMFCNKHRNRHVYTTCEGWKRHMKEHDTVWPCMPYGQFELAENGLICALCGVKNPNESHMAGHSIGDCGNTTKLRSVSRRVNLEKHLLLSHAVSDDCTRGLANKWRKTLRKNFFACGFCICIFATIHDQLNHIDTDHFKNGQGIMEWSATNVIRGLLLSPKVASSFQYMLLSDPHAIGQDLHWDWHMIEGLQRRLEMAEDTPEALALEAYQMLTFNLSRQNSYEQHPPMSFSNLELAAQSEAAMAPFSVSAESLEKDRERQTEEHAQGSEHPWFSDEYHAAPALTSCSWPNYGLPINQSDTPEAPSSLEYQTGYPIESRNFQLSGASTDARLQPVLSLIETGSRSSVTERSSTSAYDSFDTETNWHAAPSTTPSTLHSIEGADIIREQPKLYEEPTHNVKTADMIGFDPNNLAQSHSLEENSLPLDTHDRGPIQRRPSHDQLKSRREMKFQPELVENAMLHNWHHRVEPLTCDPRDLVKKRG